MFAQAALFVHIQQTLFNVETIDRRAISHMMSLQGQNPNGASGLAIPVSASADMVRESIPLGQLCQSA